MEGKDTLATIVGGALFVFLSSLLGLSGRVLPFNPPGAFAFMGEIWSTSAFADVVFAGGTILAGFAGVQLARRSVIASVVLGILAHWLVYAVSFLILNEAGPREEARGQGFGWALYLVASWGFPGLIFAALAPPLAASWWARRLAERAR